MAGVRVWASVDECDVPETRGYINSMTLLFCKYQQITGIYRIMPPVDDAKIVNAGGSGTYSCRAPGSVGQKGVKFPRDPVAVTHHAQTAFIEEQHPVSLSCIHPSAKVNMSHNKHL